MCHKNLARVSIRQRNGQTRALPLPLTLKRKGATPSFSTASVSMPYAIIFKVKRLITTVRRLQKLS